MNSHVTESYHDHGIPTMVYSFSIASIRSKYGLVMEGKYVIHTTVDTLLQRNGFFRRFCLVLSFGHSLGHVVDLLLA